MSEENEDNKVNEFLEGDDVIAICTECKSEIDEKFLTNDIFLEGGVPAVCRYCGGVVMLLDRANRDAAIAQTDRRRGIGKVYKKREY